MGVGAVLTVLILFIATVNAGGGVSFWREHFTMTCPESGTWVEKNGKSIADVKKEHKVKYENKNKGPHHCVYDTSDGQEKYYFYVQGRVCENCIELDGSVMGLVVLLDVVGTGIIMFSIYKCSKNKHSDGPSAASKAGPARSGGRGPPVPSPDYEHLRLHTRDQDPYSELNRTR